MRADVGEPRLNFRDGVRIVRGLRFGKQALALAVRLEHDLDQALRPVRRFLREASDAPARGHFDMALLGVMLARDDVEQSRLAGAVAADETDARARRNAHRRILDQGPPGDSDGEVVEDEHGRGVLAEENPSGNASKSFRDGGKRRTRNPETVSAPMSGFRVRADARPGMTNYANASATALPASIVFAGPFRSRVRSLGSASTVSIAFTIALAASGSPRWSSIIAPDQIWP